MPPSKKGSMVPYFFLVEKICIYILIKEANFLFQPLHVFVLATDGSQQDGLHLIGRQFRVIHSENELVGLDALEEHGHTLVCLKAHGEHMVLGLILQVKKAFPLFIFDELANNQVGGHREDERRYYCNNNDERC